MQVCKEFLDRIEEKVTDKVDLVTRYKPADLSITVQGINPDGTVARSFKLEGGQRKEIGQQKLLEDK